MKLQSGPLVGAVIIGVGLSWIMMSAGKSPAISVAVGVTAAVLDYIAIIWMKSKGMGQ